MVPQGIGFDSLALCSVVNLAPLVEVVNTLGFHPKDYGFEPRTECSGGVDGMFPLPSGFCPVGLAVATPGSQPGGRSSTLLRGAQQ